MYKRHGLIFAIVACLMLVAAIGAPVAAQHVLGEQVAVDYAHEGHCHLVGNCDAVSFVGHAGPALDTNLLLPAASQVSRALPSQENSIKNRSEPVPNPPPIA